VIISEKQIMHLIQIAERYKVSPNVRHTQLSTDISKLLDQIANQQSNKLKDMSNKV